MMTDKESKCASFLLYLQCYFLTIAQILGTGVLGLPVTLARSGLSPFLVTFVPACIMQILVVYFMTDILQKCVAIQLEEGKQLRDDKLVGGTSKPSSKQSDDMIPLTQQHSDHEEELFSEDDERYTRSRPAVKSNPKTHRIDRITSTAKRPCSIVRPPDLYYISSLFLPKIMSHMCFAHVMLKMTAVITAFSLAAGEAWADLLNLSITQVLPVFCWVLTFLVVFARWLVLPLVSILTFFKGSLLLATVIIAFIVGSHINHGITNDFAYIGRPLLMGTVALGGIPFVMPFSFSKIKYTHTQISSFRMACTLGILTVTLLNIFWCWAVLDVVPQVDSCAAGSTAMSSLLGDNVTQSIEACVPSNITLLHAKLNGEISTIPFKQMIELDYPQYNWVAYVVTIFIIISITVSYLVNSTIVCHTMDGWLSSHWPKDKWKCLDINRYVTTERVVSSVASLCILGLVFVIAMSNPKSFVKMLERVVSLLLNALTGIYISAMTWRVTSKKYRNLAVPVKLSTFQIHLQYLVIVYFNFAIIYDVVTWGLELSGKAQD